MSKNNSNNNEQEMFSKVSISWDNGIYGNSAESIEKSTFLKNIILHI